MLRLSKSEPADMSKISNELYVLPLNDMVVFPSMVIPIFLTREEDIRTIDMTLMKDSLVAIILKKNYSASNDDTSELYKVGTLARVLQMVRLPEGGVKILVDGLSRISIIEYFREDGRLKARVDEMREFYEKTIIVDALVQSVTALFKVALAIGRPIPEDVLKLIDKMDNPGRLADLIAVYLALKIEEQQQVLEIADPLERLKQVFIFLSKEVQVLQIRGKIQADVAREMGKTQKEYILKQQLKAIQKELGEEDPQFAEINMIRERIKSCGMPADVEKIAEKELSRLDKMNVASAEYSVAHTYLDYLTNIPWSTSSSDNLDINRAEQILNEDHYNLEKVKDRILEYLAVRKMKEGVKGPILCFVGPPGVGKTSLGRSIARAMERKFIRMSLGGMRDEAEIRGHRRTYVSALPGRIIQELKRCGTNNPVFMLDEVDKIGADFRGDPAAALLEVLDPEQNYAFRDHYLDVPFDLSKVMFITTANVLDPVPPALKDRMETITLSGYSEEEKEKIAFQFLIPKQIEENGLKEQNINFSSEAIFRMIKEYTREAGLRGIEREIASICRKIARKIAQGKETITDISPESVEDFLGPRKYFIEVAEDTDRVGVATGLAWTEAGGDIIFVEASKMSGRRGLTLTGSLGEIMKESAQAAMSYIRSHAGDYNISLDFFNRNDIHIHVPAGAIPKDGPSAGVTMVTAIASLLTGRPARRDIAMTGEITLSGRVLPIGGVKEKVLAARRAGVFNIILPERNKVNLDDVPEYIRKNMTFFFVGSVDEVIKRALK